MSALAFLEAQRVAHPDLAPWYTEMGELYERKLWHQLTLKLEQFLALAIMQAEAGGELLVQLYQNFITDFETKINLLKLAHFAVTVSRQYRDPDAAIAFCDSVISKLRATATTGGAAGGFSGGGRVGGGGGGSSSSSSAAAGSSASEQQHLLKRVEEPIIYVKMQIAALRLAAGEQRECKRLVDEAKASLELQPSSSGAQLSLAGAAEAGGVVGVARSGGGGLADVDPSVFASVYWVYSQYCKSKQDFAEFYRSALLYLAYVNVDSLTDNFKLDLAVDLSLAALLGENVYNFGELLGHPIVKVLQGSSFEWLHEVLEAFGRGDLHGYDELCVRHAAHLNAQPALVANERRLREKITILSLMELIFSRPSEERTIPLSVIAEKTKLPLDGVEHLLMKALSAHLIEGVIDQVDATVRVSWVQPHVLSVPQVAALAERLDTWLSRVHTTLLAVEAETPDLLAS